MSYQASGSAEMIRSAGFAVCPEGDVAAAVVAGDGEPIMAERLHQSDTVTGHRTLRVRLMIGRRRRLRRFAVAAQVGTDDRVVACEQRCDAMPCRMRPRMPM